MITVQEKIETTQEEFDSVNRPQRLSLSDQLQRERQKQKTGDAAKYSPGTKTFEDIEL